MPAQRRGRPVALAYLEDNSCLLLLPGTYARILSRVDELGTLLPPLLPTGSPLCKLDPSGEYAAVVASSRDFEEADFGEGVILGRHRHGAR